MAGADTVETVLGPLSTSLQGLKIFMKTIIDSEPWIEEPALIPMPWRAYSVPVDRPLRIGVLWHDGLVRPHPPVTRALRMVVNTLKAEEIEIVDFAPHLHDEAWAILASLYYPDGGEADTEDIASSGEPWRPLSEWIIKDNPCVKKLSLGELAYWLEEREAYRNEYALHWKKHRIDALLCPVVPGVAPKHNTARYWNYTSQWNMLDYPGLVFPVTTVDKERDSWASDEMILEDEKIVGVLKYVRQTVGLSFEGEGLN